MGAFDAAAHRRDFPILEQRPHGKPLVYLDNAATTQKPTAVIDEIARYYREDNANIHRGVHWLSQRATEGYERARGDVARFLHASDEREIVFLRGTTEAVNLVAHGWGRGAIGAGDAIVLSELEHHSNIVPWQMLAEEVGATIRVAPIDDTGAIDVAALEALLDERTKLVAVSHVSNALGTINPVAAITEAAHRVGAKVLVDGAQACAHEPVDVQALGCDFYAISAHKMYGPTGIGALWGRLALLESMAPFQGGGEMIARVTFEKTTYNEVPHKFEAGTPDIAGVFGFGAAIRYLDAIGLEAIAAHEHALLVDATERVSAIDGITVIGTAAAKAGILSFTIDGVHPHDAGTILDLEGVAVRTGHHCAQPVMDHFGVPATVRASFGLYNTKEDVDALVTGLARVRETFVG